MDIVVRYVDDPTFRYLRFHRSSSNGPPYYQWHLEYADYGYGCGKTMNAYGAMVATIK